MPKRKKDKKLKIAIQIRFQEILALTVVIPFLVFTTHVLMGERDYSIIQIYVPLISIILGGYFGQGAIREWRGQNGRHEQPVVEYTPDDPTCEDYQRALEQSQPPI